MRVHLGLRFVGSTNSAAFELPARFQELGSLFHAFCAQLLRSDSRKRVYFSSKLTKIGLEIPVDHVLCKPGLGCWCKCEGHALICDAVLLLLHDLSILLVLRFVHFLLNYALLLDQVRGR